VPRASSYRVQSGDSLWGIARAFNVDASRLAAANRLHTTSHLRRGQLLVIPVHVESTKFLWPARGQMVRSRSAISPYSPGLEIRAGDGAVVRAARSGRVAVAASQMRDVGNTVILDHGDGYATVYCGLRQLLVAPGTDVQQGNPVGRLGHAPLYFEVRYRTQAYDPLKVLE